MDDDENPLNGGRKIRLSSRERPPAGCDWDHLEYSPMLAMERRTNRSLASMQAANFRRGGGVFAAGYQTRGFDLYGRPFNKC